MILISVFIVNSFHTNIHCLLGIEITQTSSEYRIGQCLCAVIGHVLNNNATVFNMSEIYEFRGLYEAMKAV